MQSITITNTITIIITITIFITITLKIFYSKPGTSGQYAAAVDNKSSNTA